MNDRDEIIRSKIQEIGEESFPDNTDVRWSVKAIAHEGPYSAVEAAPQPATVGYEQFRFILQFRDQSEPAVVGCYFFDKGRWGLLFSDPAASKDWMKRFGGSKDDSAPPQTTEELPPAAVAALSRGQTIEAVKRLRAERRIGLKEAKDAVDRYLSARPDLERKMKSAQAESRRGFFRRAVLIALAIAAVYYFLHTAG